VPKLVADNGFTFDPMNEDELAARLLEMASLSNDDRQHLGEASRKIAARFDSDRFGESMEHAAMMAINLKQKRLGIIDRVLLLAAARFGR
jgi:glycosyltransferase involved in cell wall biosynthesis